ncbi:hypothetical protein [Citrobacter sp. CK205]|uniref:hypothetical protein n=1 Tax=Citrobacter sp. CK205 TaxID=2985114 RepID=UPI002574C5B3|nr:hypothetical protein [Citrobacter sp. CK205]MDM3130462.1 hypothetical protein [Citrobacter sp. CK205]
MDAWIVTFSLFVISCIYSVYDSLVSGDFSGFFTLSAILCVFTVLMFAFDQAERNKKDKERAS